MSNPLFPLPSSDFLFIHTMTVWHPGDNEKDPDDTGFATGITDTTPHDDDVPCYASNASNRDVTTYEVVDIVILCNRDYVVSKGDVIDLAAQDALDTKYVGRWAISEIRPNPAHKRVLCVKTTVESEVEV